MSARDGRAVVLHMVEPGSRRRVQIAVCAADPGTRDPVACGDGLLFGDEQRAVGSAWRRSSRQEVKADDHKDKIR